jgi:hypothetical protein
LTEQAVGAPQAVVAAPILSKAQVLLVVWVAEEYMAVVIATLTEAFPAVSWLT